MFLLKREWELYVEEEDVKRTDDMAVIDYDVANFYYYNDVLKLINKIYVTLVEMGINNELLETISSIVEKLNNLAHFHFKLNLNNEDELVQEYLSKFDTFEYKKLSEFDKSSNIKVFKAKNISEEEIAKIDSCYNKKRFEEIDDVRGNYLDYYVGALEEDQTYPLMCCKKGTKVISIMDNSNPKTILNEMLKVFNKVSLLGKDKINLDTYYFFEITRMGYHREVIYLINSLTSALNYLFNSSSFRNNEYYSFDKFEISKRTNFNFEVALGNVKRISENQLATKFNIK